MIALIIPSRSIKNSIYYNLDKEEKGIAQRIGSYNLPGDNSEIRINSMFLEEQAKLNTRVKNESTHIILSFTEEDKEVLDQETLNNIATYYLKGLGYEDQPAMIWAHTDTESFHIHIVTTPVQYNGEKIDDSFSKKKSERIRKEIEVKYDLIKAEGRNQNQETNQQSKFTKQYLQSNIKYALEYSYDDFETYKLFLSQFKINVIEKKYNLEEEIRIGLMYNIEDKKPIKASSMYHKPTYKRITENIKPSKLEEKDVLIKGFLKYDYQLVEIDDQFLLINKKNKSAINAKTLGWTNSQCIQFKTKQKQKTERKTVIPAQTTKTNIPSKSKELQVLVSRYYQDYKKKQNIYYESVFIEKFPLERLSIEISRDHKIPYPQVKEAVLSFQKFKESKISEIKEKEISYFKMLAEKTIDFIDKLELSKSNKIDLLNQLGYILLDGKVISKHSGSVYIEKIVNLSNLADHIDIPNPLSKDTINLLNQLAMEKEIKFYDKQMVNKEIIALLFRMEILIQFKGDENYSVNKNYVNILNLKQINHENEKFLNQNHINYTRKLRGY